MFNLLKVLIWWRQSVGNWLYSVAFRIASKQRIERARRSSHERAAGEQRPVRTNDAPAVHELPQLVDEELDRLPEKFRMPLLLCCLQDQTIDEAARQLGWSFPMVKGRLQRGRELLRDRLRRRGVTPPCGVLAAILVQGVVKAAPPSLLNATVQGVVTGTMTTSVAVLVKGAVQAMFWSKMKAALLVLATVGVIGFGAVLGTHGTGQPGQVAHAVPLPKQAPAEKKALVNDPVILDDKNNGKTVSVPVGTIVEVRLAGTRANTGWESGTVKGDALVHSNGQRGQAGQPPSRPGLLPLPFGSEFLPEPNAVDKAIGSYLFIYQAVKEGRAELTMQYIAPGGPGVTRRGRSTLIAQFKVTIDVTAVQAKAGAEKAVLTDQQMAALAEKTARKGTCVEVQEIRSKNPHLGGKWLLEQPLKQHQFWCVLQEYTPAAPVRSYIAVSRSGEVLFPFKSADFAKLLKAEDRFRWTDAHYLQAVALYIHLTGTPHQDGWKILDTPADFMAIKCNMFPENEKKRQQAAQAITKPGVVREKDTVRVRLWAWQLIGGALSEWDFVFAPADFKAVSKEHGRFGGGGYD